MAGFLNRLFGGGEPTSSEVAKERLRLVLVHDRSNLSPEQVEAMKDEILAVIARYVEFDREAVAIRLVNEHRESMLQAEIPIMPNAPRRSSPSAYSS